MLIKQVFDNLILVLITFFFKTYVFRGSLGFKIERFLKYWLFFKGIISWELSLYLINMKVLKF